MTAELEKKSKWHAGAIEGAKLLSFVDEDRRRLLVANHLYHGKCHSSVETWEEAEALAESAQIETGVQTIAEREKKPKVWAAQFEDKKRIG